MNPADQEQQSESTADEQERDYPFTLADERTFLAWIRTGAAVSGAGGKGVRHGLRRQTLPFDAAGLLSGQGGYPGPDSHREATTGGCLLGWN